MSSPIEDILNTSNSSLLQSESTMEATESSSNRASSMSLASSVFLAPSVDDLPILPLLNHSFSLSSSSDSEIENGMDRRDLENSSLNLSTEHSSSESLLSTSSISNFNDNEDSDNKNAPNWLHQPIYEQATLRGGDALCQILKVYVTNSLTKKALGDILTTINLFLPEDHTIPITNHRLFSLIDMLVPNSEANLSTKHRVCSDCFYYLGK